MLIEIMQPRAYHFATHVAQRGENQRPGNRPENIQRQENFRRQAACANQYRPNNAKAVHKAGANHKQVRMSLDEPLSAADFLLMLSKTL